MILSSLFKLGLAASLSLTSAGAAMIQPQPLFKSSQDNSDKAVTEAIKDYKNWVAVVDGREVSYGPLKIELPEDYVAEDLSVHDPIFYDMTSILEDYQPHFYFSGDKDFIFSTNTSSNKKALEDSLKETMDNTEGAEFVKISSFEEGTLGDYHITRASVLLKLDGDEIVDEVYCFFEKESKEGVGAMIEFYALSDDEDHIKPALEALDGVELIETYEEPDPDTLTPWQTSMEKNGEMKLKGTTVTYGPLSFKVPKGFTLEDADTENPILWSEDSNTNVTVSFGEDDSYYMWRNEEIAQILFDSYFEDEGDEAPQISALEELEVDDHPAVMIGLVQTYDDTELGQILLIVFENIDQLYTPSFTISFTSDIENENAEDYIDTIFGSIEFD